jgi:hypothetical protein
MLSLYSVNLKLSRRPRRQGPQLIAGGQIRSAVTAAALMLLRDRPSGDT